MVRTHLEDDFSVVDGLGLSLLVLPEGSPRKPPLPPEDDVADASGEDKLQKEAARRSLDPWQIAREEEGHFKEDLAVLRIKPASFMASRISGMVQSRQS